MIKAHFENLGPIKDATLELGDLTIIAGPNNSGKTYLVYTLYGFLDFWSSSDFRLFCEDNRTRKFHQRTKQIAEQIEKMGTASIDAEEYKEMKDLTMRRAASFFAKNLIHQGVFNSSKAQFEEAAFHIEIERESLNIENAACVSDDSGKRFPLKATLCDGALRFELDKPRNIAASNMESAVALLLEEALQSDCLVPYLFSAERFGISLFHKELDFTKNQLPQVLKRSLAEKEAAPYHQVEKGHAHYAQPISDNIDFTRDLYAIQKQKNKLTADKNHSVERMMGGSYKAKKDETCFVSKGIERKVVIPLHLASSSARGLADLYFYLKHAAELGQILIIDEPESHLDPANQILMARLLAFCANAGLKVLITTHSDYIIREINNLIMLHNNFKGKSKFLAKHKKDYTEKDHLDPESVKAYVCEKGSLTQCAVSEEGIAGMTVFDNTIDSINRVSSELYLYRDMDSQDD